MTTFSIIYIVITSLFLIGFLRGYEFKEGKWGKRLMKKSEEDRSIFFKVYQGWIRGAIIAGLVLSPFLIWKKHYESDSYLSDRKSEIIENYQDGKVDEGRFVPEDDYFDLATVDKIQDLSDGSESYRVIFWADREEMKEGGLWWNIEWKVRKDFYFPLDPKNEVDSKIIKLYETEKVEEKEQENKVTEFYSKVYTEMQIREEYYLNLAKQEGEKINNMSDSKKEEYFKKNEESMKLLETEKIDG